MPPTFAARAFDRDRAVHWIVSPMLSERHDDFLVPFDVGNEYWIVALRGMIIPPLVADGGE
ncbi:MAG: hypothetical protein ACYCW6_13305, partial [Candidatus Xenobia bacterium]